MSDLRDEPRKWLPEPGISTSVVHKLEAELRRLAAENEALYVRMCEAEQSAEERWHSRVETAQMIARDYQMRFDSLLSQLAKTQLHMAQPRIILDAAKEHS